MGLCAIARERFPVVAKPTSLVTQRFVLRLLSRSGRGEACSLELPTPPAPVDPSARRSSARRAQLRRFGVYHRRFSRVKENAPRKCRPYKRAIHPRWGSPNAARIPLRECSTPNGPYQDILVVEPEGP